MDISDLEKPSAGASSTTPTPQQRMVVLSELISADSFSNACVKTPEDCQAVADRIGYPVMIKASEGGGGKGIRRVTRSEDVTGLFNQVRMPDTFLSVHLISSSTIEDS